MSQEDSSNCDLLPMWPLEQCAWDRCVPWINQWGPSTGRQLKLCLVSGFKVTPWGREPPCDSAMSLLGAQLILEQPEHELCRSTYTWIFFFSSKYNNASRSVAGWILSCKTCIGKEMPLRGGWVWISGRFSTGGRWMPLKPVFFKGQLYFKGNQREISKMWLYPHHSGLKKRNTPIWNNEDEPGSHSAKWNNPEAGRQTLCDLTYIWSQKRLTEAESRIGAARGKGQRCQWWVQSFSYAWWVSSGKRTLACWPEGGLNYNFEIC